MLKGIKEVSWKSCKVVLGEPNFVQNLQDMNFDLITQQQVRAIKAHMKVKCDFGLTKIVIHAQIY